MIRDQGKASLVNATYTFNGAGVGEIKSGQTLLSAINRLHEIRGQSNEGIFTTSAARDLYIKWRTTLNQSVDVSVRGQALGEISAKMIELAKDPIANVSALNELPRLYEAIGRGTTILQEALRVNAGIPSGFGGDNAKHVDPAPGLGSSPRSTAPARARAGTCTGPHTSMNDSIPPPLRTLPPLRQERLGQKLADCAIAAEGLARRLKACDALRTGVRQHAERVAEAAFTVCEAAIAVNGCTQDLRLTFG